MNELVNTCDPILKKMISKLSALFLNDTTTAKHLFAALYRTDGTPGSAGAFDEFDLEAGRSSGGDPMSSSASSAT